MKNMLFILIVGLSITFLSYTNPIYGQLNPINNLEWSHWYYSPHNFFSLNWEEPDASEDSLVGYIIYRNDEYFTFQTENSLYHTPYEQNCAESFISYNDGEGFWIHVTAVYNSSYSESIYTDSVHCEGIIIGIAERQNKRTNLFPNPTKGKLTITEGNGIEVAVYNSSGKQVLQLENTSQINLSDFPKGVYIVKTVSGKGVSIEKVIRD